MDEGPFEQVRGKALWFAHAGADGSPLTAAGVGFGQYPAARIRRRGDNSSRGYFSTWLILGL